MPKYAGLSKVKQLNLERRDFEEIILVLMSFGRAYFVSKFDSNTDFLEGKLRFMILHQNHVHRSFQKR